KVFSGWTGATVANPSSSVTSFIMPTNDATVTANFIDLPQPNFAPKPAIANGQVTLSAQAYANTSWILQSSTDLVNWVGIYTHAADSNGVWQVSMPFNPAVSNQFFRLLSP